jgi:hypothetical protein
VGIWDQLNTKTIEDNAGTEIQVQSNPVHLQEQNRHDLSDIKLINDASLRSDGGIIPGTVEAKVGTFTDNAQIEIVAPAKGEVWQILYPIAKVTAGGVSTTVGYELWLQDKNSVQYRIYYYASTSSSPIPNEDASLWAAPLFLGEGQKLYAEISSFSATSINWGVQAGRVR